MELSRLSDFDDDWKRSIGYSIRLLTTKWIREEMESERGGTVGQWGNDFCNDHWRRKGFDWHCKRLDHIASWTPKKLYCFMRKGLGPNWILLIFLRKKWRESLFYILLSLTCLYYLIWPKKVMELESMDHCSSSTNKSMIGKWNSFLRSSLNHKVNETYHRRA